MIRRMFETNTNFITRHFFHFTFYKKIQSQNDITSNCKITEKYARMSKTWRDNAYLSILPIYFEYCDLINVQTRSCMVFDSERHYIKFKEFGESFLSFVRSVRIAFCSCEYRQRWQISDKNKIIIWSENWRNKLLFRMHVCQTCKFLLVILNK